LLRNRDTAADAASGAVISDTSLNPGKFGPDRLKRTRRAVRMTMRGRALTKPFATSPNDKSNHALVYDVPASEVPRGRVRTSLARSNGDATVIVPIRHK